MNGSTSVGDELTAPQIVVPRPKSQIGARLSAVIVGAGVVAAIACAALILLPIQRETKGAVIVVLMLILVTLRVPVGVALALPGFLAIYAAGGFRAIGTSLGSMPYDTAASWSLSVIPMFILMGVLLWRSGATAGVYDVARAWLGWMPGGLAVATNAAGAGMAAASGSTIGISYALGRVGIPEMLKAGYDSRLATGSVMMAGTIGQIIPPSIILVVYAGVAQVPVGPQLMAGVLPGIVLTLLYMTLVIVRVLVNPALAPKIGQKYSARDRFVTLAKAWPVPFLMLIVLGGMYFGFFTATEAGALGALGAVICGAWYFRRPGYLKQIGAALKDTLISVGPIFFLLIGAEVLNRGLATTGVTVVLARWLEGLGLSTVGFLLLLLVFYVLLGMVMEPIPMILLTVPILMPALEAYDVSLIWFGVFIVALSEIAIISPPVGILCFVVYRLVQSADIRSIKEISLWDVFRGAFFFLPASLLFLLLLIFVPDLALWLGETTK